MKKARYAALALLSSLWIIVGCNRREILDDYPVTETDIRLNWEEVTGQLPEGVRVIFYPKDSRGRKTDTYLPAKGGKVKVPPGRYSAVVYNHDIEVVQVKEEGSYETIMACTGNCTETGTGGTDGMVWGPDRFYTATLDDVEIGKEGESPVLEIKPKPVVTSYTFSIKTEGLKNILSILGSVSGMAECYHLGKGTGLCRFAPIYCETGKGDGVIKGSFTCFGRPGLIQARTGVTQFLSLVIVKLDGSRQEVEIEITEAVKPPENGGEGDKKPQEPEIEIKLPDDEKIVVEDVKVPPDDNGGGGIGGEVGDWDDGDEIVIPVG